MAGYVLYSLDPAKVQRLIDQPTDAELALMAEILHESLEDTDEEEADPVLKPSLSEEELKALVKERLARPDWYDDLSTDGKHLWEGLVWDIAMDNLDERIDVGFECESDGVYWDVIEECWERLGVVPNQVSNVAMSTFGVTPLRCTPPKPDAPKTREEFDAEQEQRLGSLKTAQSVIEEAQADLLSGKMTEEEFFTKLQESGAGEVAEMMRDMMDILDDDDEEDESDLDEMDDDVEEYQSMHSMHLPDQVAAMQSELESIADEMSQHDDEEIREEFTQELLPIVRKVAKEKRILFIQVDT